MRRRASSFGWLVILVAFAVTACGGRARDDDPSPVPVADAATDDDGAVEGGDAGAPDDERPACAEGWGDVPGTEPHWVAFDDLGELRMVDISDPNSTAQAVSSSLLSGERVSVLEPGWSPNGRWFAFASTTDDYDFALHAVEVVDGELGAPQRVLEAESGGEVSFEDFAWSPQGPWLAYVEHGPEDAAPRTTLMLRALAADGPIAAATGQRLSSPQWSPDGSKLTLRDQETGAQLLLRIDDQGQATVHELQNGSGVTRPIWSPDSRFLVWVENGLQLFDTASDPPRETTLADATARTFSGLEWSHDSRFIVMQRYTETEDVVLTAFDTSDLATEPLEMAATWPHGATPFAIASPDEVRSADFTFVPGEHAIVTAMDEGWTYFPLRSELGEPRVIAPLDAGIVGFSDTRELLWIDAAGIYATPLDGGDARNVVQLNDDLVYDEHGWYGRNVLVAPARDRFAVADTGSSSAFDLVLSEGCTPTHVAVELPNRWSGLYVPNQYSWAWLHDGRRLMQQSESADHSGAIDTADHTARLELITLEAGRAEIRTLLETPISPQDSAFEWREQP